MGLVVGVNSLVKVIVNQLITFMRKHKSLSLWEQFKKKLNHLNKHIHQIYCHISHLIIVVEFKPGQVIILICPQN